MILAEINPENIRVDKVILLSSSPDQSWMSYANQSLNKMPQKIKESIEEAERSFEKNKTSKSYSQLMMAWAPYYLVNSKNLKYLEKIGLESNLEIYLKAREFYNNMKPIWISWNFRLFCLAGEQDKITPISLFASNPHFSSSKCDFNSIKNAGHFPWIDNPEDTTSLLNWYISC